MFLDGNSTERPENLVPHNPLAHSLHSKALFALEPCGINEENTELRARLWWPKPSRPAGPTVGFKIPYNLELAGICLYNPLSHQTIKSGNRIVVTTPDPRLAALSGAAEPGELDDNDNDDVEGMDDFGLQLMSALQSSSVAHRLESSPPSSLSDGSGSTVKHGSRILATATNTEIGNLAHHLTPRFG
ncbi:hypothetical protein AnigIFM63326_009143 [Aspergillus niger]|nr:hypothetical protein AnigIFM63326_009143 [Aspergillus niger]